MFLSLRIVIGPVCICKLWMHYYKNSFMWAKGSFMYGGNISYSIRLLK